LRPGRDRQGEERSDQSVFHNGVSMNEFCSRAPAARSNVASCAALHEGRPLSGQGPTIGRIRFARTG
jgi:hypothetical protein